MILSKYSGSEYKCIENSGEVIVHESVTRLVGQNEAGKTALLELLHTLRPIGGASLEFVLEDFPRGKLSKYKKIHETEPHVPVRAEFRLEDNEVASVEKQFGKGVLKSPVVELSKKYGAKGFMYWIKVDEQAYIKHFLDQQKLEKEILSILIKAKTIKELQVEIGKLGDEPKKMLSTLTGDLVAAIYKTLSIPFFFYFDEYAALPGEISLKKLKQFIETENYTGADAESLRTAKALIDIAGADVDEFLSRENFERLKADLEAASNEITDQLRRFWTTNQNLEIRFDLEPVLNTSHQLVDTKLHVRVYNTKHRVTVPFEKRSKGFVWFFSFLVAFSEYRGHDEQIILLLDEPGTNLGAVAQRDLMKYFEVELTPYHQIIYTTHSPFMIDSRQLDTVRTVEDGESGTQVSNDPCKHTQQTLFPLQAALGYDLTQTFYVAPNNLLVEGPADLIYFNLTSQILEQNDKKGLSADWTVVPVGGADKIAAFVSLLGAQGLNLAVFMDATANDKQKFQSILANKLMLKKNLITVGSVLGKTDADVEDLFSVSAYLKLVNLSYAKVLGNTIVEEKDLTDRSPRIIKKLESYFAESGLNNGKFNHYKPAFDLMSNSTWINDVLDAETLSNFEKAFAVLNSALAGNLVETESLPVKKLKVAEKRTAEVANMLN